MDADGNIYKGENVPPEDAARLNGYLRGVVDGVTDDVDADAIYAVMADRDDALAEVERLRATAENEVRARDLSDALRIKAEKSRMALEARLREFEDSASDETRCPPEEDRT